MRVLVVGGAGRTGRSLVRQLARAGHKVVATIRRPEQKAAMKRLGAEVAILDLVHSPRTDFVSAFEGANAIVFAAGSAAGEGSALDRTGLVKSVQAAKAAGVRRYVTISSIGASTGMRLTGAWATEEMKDYYRQKRAANAYLRASGLDWTILEPGELTEKKATGKVSLSVAPIEDKGISRDDVAAVIVAVLGEPKSIGQTFQLTSGELAVSAALRRALGR